MPPKKTTHLERVRAMMASLSRIRNCSLIGHVDHGKTTMSDSLLASSGLLNPALAGTAHLLDFLDEEQARGITMKSANISLVHEQVDGELLVNLVDTPGHVDFSGKVTRALQLIDAAIVVVDAVEGVMIQTEHVVRQAIENAVKPLLFINKIDRLVKELDLSTAQIQQKFKDIIDTFNSLVPVPWHVDLVAGSVVFGSALDGWGATFDRFRRHHGSFAEVVAIYKAGGAAPGELKLHLPLHAAILDMIVSNAPSPVEAQAFRIPRIWHGPSGTPVEAALLGCVVDAPVMIFVSKVHVEHGLLVATGRVFCGSIRRGDEVHLIKAGTTEKVGDIGIFMGQRIVAIDEVLAGNIVAIKGLKGITTGETLAGVHPALDPSPVLAFEQPGYLMEPVITVCIEPARLADLDKLQRILAQKHVEDPNLVVDESERTGEILVSGIGPLHLEVTVNEIRKEGIDVHVSDPITLFHESVTGRSSPVTVKSTNGFNEIRLTVEPVGDEHKPLLRQLVHARDGGQAFDGEAFPWPIPVSVTPEMVVTCIATPLSAHDSSLLVSSLARVAKHGPLVGESMRDVVVVVDHLVLAKDPAASDVSEVIPMLRQALFDAMTRAGATLLEPMFESTIHGSADGTGKITSLLAQHGGKIDSIDQDGRHVKVKARFPVRTSFDLIEDARSVTSGRAVFQNAFGGFEPVPKGIAASIVAGVKARKGLI